MPLAKNWQMLIKRNLLKQNRYFCELDSVLQSYYELDEAWTAVGSFRIPFLIRTEATSDYLTALSGEDSGFTGNPVVFVDAATGLLNLQVPNGVDGYGSAVSTTAVNDGKLHVGALTFDVSTNTYGLEVDSILEDSVIQSGVDNSFKFIGSKVGTSEFFDGIIANTLFKDLDNPTNSLSFKLNELSDVMECSLLNTYGPELITNGDFSDGLTGYVNDDGGKITVENGKAVLTVTNGDWTDLVQYDVMAVGKTYLIEYDCDNQTDEKALLQTNNSGVGTGNWAPFAVEPGESRRVSEIVTIAAGASGHFQVYTASAATTGTKCYIDNVSIREIRTLNYINIPESNRHPWQRVSKIWNNLDGTELTFDGDNMYVKWLAGIPIFAGDVISFTLLASNTPTGNGYLFRTEEDFSFLNLSPGDGNLLYINRCTGTLDGEAIVSESTLWPYDAEEHEVVLTATATGTLGVLGCRCTLTYWFTNGIKNLVITRANPSEQYPDLSYLLQDGYSTDGKIAQSIPHSRAVDGSVSVDMTDGFVFTDWLTYVDPKYGNKAEDINNGATTVEGGVYFDYETEAAPQYAGVTGYETLAERAVLSGLTELEEAQASAAEGLFQNGDFRFGDIGTATKNAAASAITISEGKCTVTSTEGVNDAGATFVTSTLPNAYLILQFDLEIGTIRTGAGTAIAVYVGGWRWFDMYTVSDGTITLPIPYDRSGTGNVLIRNAGTGRSWDFTVSNLSIRPVGQAVIPTDEAARRSKESLVKNGDLRLGDNGDWEFGETWSIKNSTLIHSGTTGDAYQQIIAVENGTYTITMMGKMPTSVVNTSYQVFDGDLGNMIGQWGYNALGIGSVLSAGEQFTIETEITITNGGIYFRGYSQDDGTELQLVIARKSTNIQVLEDTVGHGQVIGDSASDWSDTTMEEA